MHVYPSVNELNPSFKYLYPSICRAHTYMRWLIVATFVLRFNLKSKSKCRESLPHEYVRHCRIIKLGSSIRTLLRILCLRITFGQTINAQITLPTKNQPDWQIHDNFLIDFRHFGVHYTARWYLPQFSAVQYAHWYIQLFLVRFVCVCIDLPSSVPLVDFNVLEWMSRFLLEKLSNSIESVPSAEAISMPCFPSKRFLHLFFAMRLQFSGYDI